ncbi:MAG: [FeFe] hydrogenase H-cluster maturation GTPase HydF [Candidatus Adiutrix sp.]|jgi:[FeFe] hydrogenase H-cluster maturation GTPase HydF|nr:[FeFe] hydrogenase H-cluster maturation GTPase HydF [Candidatus Adiutrix sp.]
MESTPRANRLAIAFFGRRNVSKSSLINALTGQEVSLISDVPGSTADPVSKSMELLPIGPITVIDTAGLDDEGELGAQKVRRAKTILNQADLAVLVCDASNPDKSWEAEWLKTMPSRGGRVLVVENKADLAAGSAAQGDWLPVSVPRVRVSAASGEGLELFKDALVALAAQSPAEPSLIAGLFPRNSLFMLVTPQDPQAPKGRLILPQVQVIRDILDHGGLVSMADFADLESQIKSLARRPDLVIVDAQVFGRVAKIIPEDWPITAFSIIMARAKGDLHPLAEGARHIDRLKPGAKVLIAEACTHHAMKNDIARERIPKLLTEKVGGPLNFEVLAGNDFADDLSSCDLIVCCGGCMITRGHFMARMKKAMEARVPMTNFGLTLAHLNGYLDRAMAVFKNDGSA